MSLFDQWRNFSAWTLFCGGFLGIAWLALGAALFGWLAQPVSFFLVGLLTVALGLALLRLIKECDGWRLGLLTLLGVFVSFTTLTAEPSIFSGRDQGSIAEAAWRLAENGQLAFSTVVGQTFFDIYGPGTALNFPGFAYTDNGSLITQFPLAYTAWLAPFLAVFELDGYTIGNTVLFFFFGWSFFELLLLFVPRPFAVIGTALAVLNFLPVWMAKFTLTENLAAVLFVMLAIATTRLLCESAPQWYWLGLATAGLFPFVRIEGFAFFVLWAACVAWRTDLRQRLLERPWRSLMVPGLFLLFIGLRDFYMNLPFYKMIGKALVKKWNEFGALGNFSTDDMTLSLGGIFLAYGLFGLFLGGGLGLLATIRAKQKEALLLLLLASPTLLYLFFPFITHDHPWMLRRFFFSLYPLAVFFVTLGLFLIHRSAPLTSKRTWFIGLGVFGLFLLQIGSLTPVLRFSDHQGLWAAAESFAERLTPDDLVLIDRGASGDPFAMLAGPLNFMLGKSTVYFFNPADLARIDTTPYRNVYLLVPGADVSHILDAFPDQLRPLETVSFTSERLIPPDHAFASLKTAPIATDAILFEIRHP